jgi:hypothetical protein
MTAPELTGALEGLKALDVADLARFKAAVAAGRQDGWCYYLPYLLARNRRDRRAVLVAEDNGSLCVYFWRLRESGPRLDLYLPPIPLNVAVLDRCLERANELNGDRSARILRIDDREASVLSERGRLRLEPRRSQYLYRPDAYADLGGRKLRTLRRQCALVEGLPDLEVAPFSAEHADDCHALLRRWRTAHRAAHGDAGGAGAARRAIDLAGRFPDSDLRGEMVRVDGRLVAFAFGGEIRPGLGCFFEAKADTSVPGLSYFLRRSFLLRMRDFEIVNDGSDQGRAGLRQLKDSLRPVAMHAEYRGRQRRR